MILGAKKSGKTSLINKFIHKKFNKEYTPT